MSPRRHCIWHTAPVRLAGDSRALPSWINTHSSCLSWQRILPFPVYKGTVASLHTFVGTAQHLGAVSCGNYTFQAIHTTKISASLTWHSICPCASVISEHDFIILHISQERVAKHSCTPPAASRFHYMYCFAAVFALHVAALPCCCQGPQLYNISLFFHRPLLSFRPSGLR